MPPWNSRKSDKYARLSARMDGMEETLSYLRQMDEKKTKEIKDLNNKNNELETKLSNARQESPQSVEELNQGLEKAMKIISGLREELEIRLSEIETNCANVNKKTADDLERQMHNLEQNHCSLELVESVNSLIGSLDKVDAIENDIKRSRNDTYNYRQNFSKRLCALENERQENQRQMQTIFLQNADLQGQVDAVTRRVEELRSSQNVHLTQTKNNVSDQEKQLRSMRCVVVNLELRKQICDHLSLTQRMIDLETQVKCMKEDQQRVAILEAELTDIRKETTSHQLAVKRNMDWVEKQVKSLKGNVMEAGEIQAGSGDYDYDDEAPLTVNNIGAVEKQIRDIHAKVQALDAEAADKKTTSFWSHIYTSRALSIKTWAKMDRCKSAQSPGNNFKKSKCVFEPPRNGLYGLSVYMMQEGHGKLRTRLSFDDGRTGSGGITDADGDVTACLTVWTLRKGQKISVEVMQEEGQAQVYFCAFSGFLICPL